MIAIVLCAAVDTELEREIRKQYHENPFDSELTKLHGLPKSLIPIAGSSMLDRWWAKISKERNISSIYLCVNGAKCRHFERWCSERGIAHKCIVNDGVTCREDAIGSAADLVQALRRARQHGHGDKDVMVLAGDHLFFKTFDLEGAVNFYNSNKIRTPHASALLYYTLKDNEDPSQRGMVVVNGISKKIERFIEKPSLMQQMELFGKVGNKNDPANGGDGQSGDESGGGGMEIKKEESSSTNPRVSIEKKQQKLGSPMFYIFSQHAVEKILDLVQTHTEQDTNVTLSCGRLVEMLTTTTNDESSSSTPFYGMRLPSAFGIMNCSSKLSTFRDFERIFSAANSNEPASFDSINSVTVRSYARTGLMGNPSDGMYGKTLGITVSNFWAEVHLSASDRIILHPHPLYDPSEFGSLSDLYKVCKKEGYMGGMRLLQATLKKFAGK